MSHTGVPSECSGLYNEHLFIPVTFANSDTECLGTVLDLPQVDSLTFLVMTRYIGTIKKLKRVKTPQIDRAPKARASFEVPKVQEASRLVNLAGNQIA